MSLTPSAQQVFEVEALLRVSMLYRERLRSDPADMVARTGLAWSLFLQSLFQAGQEQVLATPPAEWGSVAAPAGDRDARKLLTECLQQVTMVHQLCEHPRERADMDRLQTLIRLAGEATAVCHAEDEAAKILGQVTRAIFEGDDEELPDIVQPQPAPRSRRRLPQPRPEVTESE